MEPSARLRLVASPSVRPSVRPPGNLVLTEGESALRLQLRERNCSVPPPPLFPLLLIGADIQRAASDVPAFIPGCESRLTLDQ